MLLRILQFASDIIEGLADDGLGGGNGLLFFAAKQYTGFTGSHRKRDAFESRPLDGRLSADRGMDRHARENALFPLGVQRKAAS